MSPQNASMTYRQAAKLLATLDDRGQTLTVAESCTGGLLGGALTAVPGASRVFLGGFIVYADRVKQGLLEVPSALLRSHGAVSIEVVEAMARGACDRLGADWALTVSGIAGPEGGNPQKPVGTVVIGCLGLGGGLVRVHHFEGDRQMIRTRTVSWALSLALELLGP